MRYQITKILFVFCFLFMGSIGIAKDPITESTHKYMGAAYLELWNDSVQKRIDERIEKYRKADGQISLKNVKVGSRISIEQIGHDFLFGAHFFNFDQLGSDFNEQYKALFGKLFNAATLSFYWDAYEPEPGQMRFHSTEKDEPEFWDKNEKPWDELTWRRPAPDRVMDYCEKHGIQMHGHPMIYLRTHPKWISKKPEDLDQVEKLFAKHIQEITSFAKGRIGSWDVVNESVDPVPGKPRYGYLLPKDYTFKAYKQAEAEFPKSVKLIINDSWRDVYPIFIKDLLDRGAKIDMIGLQMHIFGSKPVEDVAAGKTVFPNGTSWKPADVEKYLTELDQFGKPIHLSEITIPAPGTDDRANAIQARITRDMYRLWFSWPSIYRITWWNVVDDCGYKGEPSKSGLFTRQMHPKTAFYVLHQLINHDWKTKIVLTADQPTIHYHFRGFKGTYRVRWIDGSGKEQEQIIAVR